MVAAATGRQAMALACSRRAVANTRASGQALGFTNTLNVQASVELAAGCPDDARRLYEESVALFERPGAAYGPGLQTALAGLGQVALAEHDLGLARHWLNRALAMTQGTVFEKALALLGYARLLREEGDLAVAAEALAFVEAWTAAWHETRTRAAEQLRAVESYLPRDVLAAAVARGRARQFDDLRAELLYHRASALLQQS
jgi:hypothetical protein